MRKKILTFAGLVIIILGLSSCNLSNTKDPDVIEKEPEIVQIENNITDTFEQVEKACVGIRVVAESSQGSGSGVIYKELNGYYYVLTNHHVIDNALKIQVYLGSLIYYNATLVGSDAKNDLAVVKFKIDIYGGNVKVLDITSNDDIIKTGQTVIAVGCPLGLEQFNSLSVGVVSKVNSSTGKIQHTAQINPGNSGGGLFNLSGRLIGLNTEKVTSTEGSVGEFIPIEGMGYSIGMDVIRKVVADIEKLGGNIERPQLLITVALINRYISDANLIELLPSTLDQAVVVQSLDNGSGKTGSGYAAGLKTNDVIIEINGTAINYLDNISAVLNTSLYGDTLIFKLLRYNSINKNYESITLNVELVKY